MNEIHDESLDDVERELLRHSPRSASAQLRSRIEAAIDRPLIAHRWYAPLALAASLLVAAALIGLLLDRRPASNLEPRLAQTQIAPPVVDSTAPTLLAYRRALMSSEQDLVALLDAHAAARMQSAPHVPAAPSLSPLSPLEIIEIPSRPGSAVPHPPIHPSKDQS